MDDDSDGLQGPSSSLPIFQLAATASRAASGSSHAICYADSRPGDHSQGIQRLRGRWEAISNAAQASPARNSMRAAPQCDTIQAMQVFALRYPGTWINGLQNSHEAGVLLSLLEHHLADASLGLGLFEEALARPRSTPGWMRRQSTVQAIQRAMESQLPPNLTPEQRFAALDDIRETADLQARQQEWAAGILPDSYERQLLSIHAHTVAYALDDIDKKLGVLAGMSGVPGEVSAARDKYLAALPYLRQVRDSAHHTEDRARGLGSFDRPITLQPISNTFINAPGGSAIVLNFLNGNKLGYTSADGNLRELEITANSVAAAQVAIQGTLNAFSWRGPARGVPS